MSMVGPTLPGDPLARVAARIAAIEQRVGATGFGALFAQAQVASVSGSSSQGASVRRVASAASEAAASSPESAGVGWAGGLPAKGQRWAEQIEAAAGKAGVDPRLLAALVWTESGFNAEARSHAGAIGLTQLMPATARGLKVDPTDPRANLEGGARYLRAQLDRFGSVKLALAAYNAGPGRVAQAGGVPRITETQRYVQRVTDRYSALR